MDYAGDLTFFSIVSHPTVADKRCYPIRSIIVITSVLSTLVMSLVIIMIRFRIKQRNAKA
jgi:LPS O-antigen subunit length determinant protein (WzzB/FepE family)